MEKKRRILLVDDNKAIHEDIEAILISSLGEADQDLVEIEDELFGESESPKRLANDIIYSIDHAYQGEEAIEMVDRAEEEGYPYALIFMDVRMPPGIDGVEAIQKIWEKYPHVEVVICTAYSDYSWEQIVNSLGNTDKLLFVKKPFDATALKQMALTLTTKWKLQQKAIKYTEHLEREVEERTRALNQLVEDFKRMKEKAEQASAAKSEFLANVSHEIRTPMNGVIGMNNMLLETDLTREQRELTQMAKSSAESLMKIIDDILDFSKIEAGKMQLERIPFNLRDVVKHSVKLISLSAGKEEIEVTYSLDDAIPDKLVGDPTRIQEVLLNYGTNAVKFTSEGSITFSVACLDETEDDMYLKFSVADTGIGIPEDKQACLFEPFSQADTSTTRKYGGTGLGLAICKKLAELMGGEAGLTSRLGEGSTFWITARLYKTGTDSPTETIPEHERLIQPYSGADGSQKNCNILIAEDNLINQKVVQKILEKEGHSIDVVANGLEAVKAAETAKYDVILMDIHMPQMDGLDATRKIREMEETSGERVAVIALTASAMKKDKDECLKAGMDDYIIKPINKGELIKAINRVMYANADKTGGSGI